MGKIICYTSFTFSYLGKARLLAWSVKRFHPDWEFIALITDMVPPGFVLDLDNENFDNVLWGQQDLSINDIDSWLFTHNIVEICTAVKGPALNLLINSDADKVIYLDPDIAVFSSLQYVVDLLDDYDIVLTPHQLAPDISEMAVCDNEIGSLKHGIYNLGFIAVSTRSEGKRFAQWWSDRLLQYCYDDIPNGLFTDQRWCDHVPVFFDRVKILKDPGFNVASWNLSNRKFSITQSGQILINEKYLLRFYHFTKLGLLGETMTMRYAKDNIEVYEIWNWYEKKLIECFDEKRIPQGWWYYGVFESGGKISQEMRECYKKRKDVQRHFPLPYCTGANSFERWYQFHIEGKNESK